MAILNSRLTPREARARVARRILSSSDTSALLHATDVTPMPSSEGALGRPAASDGLYEGYARVDRLPEELYREYDVKRGLRNADGSGVLVGLTTISNVHGYNKVGGTSSVAIASTTSWRRRTGRAALATRRSRTCSSQAGCPTPPSSRTSTRASTRVASCPRAT